MDMEWKWKWKWKWQDDVLEVDSDDEGKGQQTSTVKALTKHARGQAGDLGFFFLFAKAFLKEAPAEADSLDKCCRSFTASPWQVHV